MRYGGVIINGINLFERFGLLSLTDLKISSPALKSNFKDVPGMHGSLNLSYALTGEPVYKDRDVTFTLYKRHCNDKKLELIRRDLFVLCHGMDDTLIHPVDPQHYFSGVISIGELSGEEDGKIPVAMVANPWRSKLHDTIVKATLTGEYMELHLANEHRYVSPTFIASNTTDLIFGGKSYKVMAGDTKLYEMRVPPGGGILKAKADGGGTLEIRYREARL